MTGPQRIRESRAVIAWAARGLKAQAFLNRASRNGLLIVLPAVLVAAAIARSRRASGSAGTGDATVDALVVAEAVLGGASALLTGDVDALSALANGYPHVRVDGI